MEIFLTIGIFLILTFLVWDKFLNKKESEESDFEKVKNELDFLKSENSKLEVKNEELNRKNGELSSELEEFKKETATLSERGKQSFAQKTQIESDYKNLQIKYEEVSKKLTQFESEKEKREKEFEQKISELENSRKSLEDEKIRIRREDEEKLQAEQEARDRIWNEHEVEAISKMKEVCKKPEISFNYYENTNLPDSFDGKLKPDFLLEFLGQYIIFDAKMSRSANLQIYLNDQVKSTAKKIKAAKNADEIYSTVFFVIPQIAIEELKKVSFYEDGFNFFVITPEVFEAVVSSFKKITYYENIESIDPKERENIVNLIASYDQHISHRNAVDILSAISGVKISQNKENLSSEMLEEIELKKSKIRIDNFKPTDLKRLIQDPEEQINEMKKLVASKKAEVKKKDLEEVGNLTLPL